MELDKTPPSAPELEDAILGAILLEKDAINEISGFLTVDDFYSEKNQHVFQAITELHEAGKPVDILTVSELLKAKKNTRVTPYEVSQLTNRVGSAANIEYHGRIVAQKSMQRQLIEISNNTARDAYDDSIDVFELMDRTEQNLLEMVGGKTQGRAVSLNEGVKMLNEKAEQVSNLKPGEISGVDTGFVEINRVTSGFQNTDLVILAARPGMGKDQPLHSKIKTPTGWKTMGEMKVGDKLASIDGGDNEVLGVYPQGLKDVYEIEFSDGRKTRCGGGHLWRVYNRKWKEPKVVETLELLDYLNKPSFKNRIYIDMVSGDFGSKNEIDIDPWLIGFLIGDGHTTNSSILFSTDDAESLYRVQKFIPKGCKVVFAEKYTYRIIGEKHGYNELLSKFRKHGYLNKRSYEKSIPESLMLADKETRISLIQGLMDSDGYVEKHKSVRYSTSSKKLSTQIQELIRSLGGTCSISVKQPYYTHKGEKKQGRTHYICNIRIKDSAKYVNIFKKKSRATSPVLPRLNVKSIKKVGVEKTQCIKVSHPTETYITDDYIVTHNTSLAIQIGVNAAKMNQKTLIFSLEMSTLQLTSRIASAETGIASGKMTKTGMSAEEWAQYHDKIGAINDLPLQIDDSAGMTIQRIRSIARVHKMKQGLDFIVLDYLQLVAAEKGKNDHEATNEIARNCKLIAKELNVPFLVLSQLSRAVETRGGSKKPQLSDLRGSGGIEEHADTVCFLYRPDYYGAETDHNGEAIEPGYTELEFAKHRSGALDTAKLRFIGELTKFEDYAPSNHFPSENYSRMPTNPDF